MIKKILNLFLIMVLSVPYLIIPTVVKGQTLGELKEELKELEKNLNQNEEEKQLTQQQIDVINQNIINIRNDIDQINKDIVNLSNEINELTVKIEEKKKEIASIMTFLQLSGGESVYLEYAFGATDFTDFIYRASVAEQLASYNDKLIADFNKMITDNEKKKVEKNDKNKALEKKQTEFIAEGEKLGKKMSDLSGENISIKDEIKARKELVESFEANGCGNDETLNDCIARQMVATSKLYRPIDYGWVTSRFGRRTYLLNGRTVTDYHYGLDVSRSGWSVPVYASGLGVVGAIMSKTSCGGNVVVIWHRVDNVEYSTVYMHLRTINVNVSDVVTPNDVIGTMGGNPATETWDSCSSGQHLHFATATGHYLKTRQYDYAMFKAKTFDPANIVNFPSGNGYFSDRTSYYK